jgi:hypothetical protein
MMSSGLTIMSLLLAGGMLPSAMLADQSAVRAEAGCTLTPGFRAIRDQIPDIVGACLDDEHVNPENGNAEQRTTGGLLVWIKVTNRTAFTDGAVTWLNGPFGLQARPNAGPLFGWEELSD